MKLTILGSNAAALRWQAHPTAQVLEIAGRTFLIDCGEATQMQLRRSKVKFSRIKQIFISHLHGDHYYGLIGLISSFELLGRKVPLTVYGPKGIKNLITIQLEASEAQLTYPLHFVELNSDTSERVYEDDKVMVDTIPLRHRIYCNGYLFRAKLGQRRIAIEAANEAEIDVAYFNKLKQGYDVLNKHGELIPNASVTLDPHPPKSYAFCSDTMYYPKIIEQLKGIQVLYHESTFLDSHKHLCERTMHSTAKEAARIAKSANVKTLVLGHYSGRYKDLEDFRREAQEIFPEVRLAKDLKEISF
ncbi:MAG TPA: ribonuclease Z [Flavobacteriaceae bacterium]|nr:ribonuclease Z [Flavobacteriaceae bacterium]